MALGDDPSKLRRKDIIGLLGIDVALADAGGFFAVDESESALQELGPYIDRTAIRVRRSATQTIPTNAYTKILFDTEDFDTKGEFASNKFTCTRDGIYKLGLSVFMDDLDDNDQLWAAIYINGSRIARMGNWCGGATQNFPSMVGDLRELSADDFVEGYVWHNQGGDQVLLTNGDVTYLTIMEQ